MTVNTPENKVETTLPQEKTEVEVSQKQQESSVSQQPQKASENKQAETPPEDPNWRAFREARKKDRAEKEEAQRKFAEKEAEATALRAAMEAAFAKSTPQVSQYAQENQYHEESDDEKIERKVKEQLALREAAYEKERMQREHQEYPQRLTQTYNDFHQTISQENLDYLDYHYPEVSRPLQRLGDGFDKWSDIYKAVKKFVPNNQTAKKDAAKADANFAKPKSLSSTGMTQVGESQGSAILSEERKAANWARMQAARRSVG